MDGYGSPGLAIKTVVIGDSWPMQIDPGITEVEKELYKFIYHFCVKMYLGELKEYQT